MCGRRDPNDPLISIHAPREGGDLIAAETSAL